MSWKIVSKLKSRRDAESGALTVKRGAAVRICLVYPNRYRIGMSNLGFQSVYAMLNAYPDIMCERAFLPDPEDLKEQTDSRTPLLSLESQQPVSGFDLVAFSVSFECDYLNIPAIFRLCGLAPYTADRTPRDPLIIAGGAAVFLNPEPIADFMDAVCLGEAEPLLPGLIAALCAPSMDRDGLRRVLADQPGIYVPSLVRRESGTIIPRLHLPDLDTSRVATVIQAPGTEFSGMHLVELSRGCPRGCRFCAAGYIYLPYRQRSNDAVMVDIDEGIAAGRKIGLVAAAIGDYAGIEQVCRRIVAAGGSFSVSSLRIDGLDETMIDLLGASGHKTATLAPEGGSQRLRDLIRKGISEEQILAACERLIGKDILNLKLYFIVGLPTETDDDISEMIELVLRIRELVVTRAKANKRLGEITLSINPFIPKPFTPFQWCGMMPIKLLEKRLAAIQSAFRPVANVSVQSESLKDAVLQAFISRGARDLAPFLLKCDESGSWRKAARDLGLDVEAAVTRDIPLDEKLPWEFIGSVSQELLKREFQKAFPGS